ncbi:KxYKxGKxW signal peptide domain-containing protein [Lactiplantibacillus plajomi]|uniref:KxYKxGKxW signal peptide domain-containing protein n=2 Tax=Lactiplantibacillus plajomi TaxID=1457217 RepID=A0ABV6K4P3_9LACO|nr:KxYKxGKxW signal peptide domain-containing protein [Lactiplantibacillus plajomi]
MRAKINAQSKITRYKMFKSGKRWVYAGITLASLGTTLMMTTNANAATEQPSVTVPQTTVVKAATVASDQSSAAAVTTPAADAQTPANEGDTSDQTSSTTDADTPEQSDATTDTTSDTPATDSTTTTETSDDPTDVTTTGQAQPDDSTKSNATDSATEDTKNTDATDKTASSTGENEDVVTDDVETPADDNTSTTVNVDDLTDADADTLNDSLKAEKATAESTPTTTSDDSHGPVYRTDDTKLDHNSKVTIEQTGPYAITWKEVSTTTKTETKTFTLDASDFVNLYKAISEAAGTAVEKSPLIKAAKAQLSLLVNQLEALPSKVASQLVGNLLYQMIFTGSGSEALSNFRTTLDPTRYDISNTWTGLDPVAYADDRAAAETFYPAAVDWYNNVEKETWTLPEFNDPTQNVRATYIQNGDATKTVVIGQGWTERPDWIGYVSKIWYDMGYNILMPSQRGQFLSDGNDMTFGYQDKYDWLNWVKKVDERNGEDSEVVFYGQSLGADTVLEAASVPGLSPSVKAVIADAGYSTLPELGSSLYNKVVATLSEKLQAIGLPALKSLPLLPFDQVLAVVNDKLVKTQGFSLADISGVDAASKVTIPLMLIHTADDAFIPYTQSLELAKANNSDVKEVWILPGTVGGHAGANNAVLQYTQHIKDFLAAAYPTNVDTGEVDTDKDDQTTTDPDTGDTGKTDPETDDDTDNTGKTDPETGDDTDNTGKTDPETGDDNDNTGATDPETGDDTDNTGKTDPETGDDNDNTGTTDPETGDDNDNTGATGSETGDDTDNNGATDQDANDDTDNNGGSDLDTDDDRTTVTDTDGDDDDQATDDRQGSISLAEAEEEATNVDQAEDNGNRTTKNGTVQPTTAPSAAEPKHLAPVTSPVAKMSEAHQAANDATGLLPQTADQAQPWLIAIGSSLMTFIAGLWLGLRRRFEH